MKKITAIMLILTLTLLSLAGCGTAEESTQQAQSAETASAQQAASASSDSGPTVLTILTTHDLTEFETALENAHPEIDLQVEVTATATINGEVSRRLRNDHGTDLIVTNLPAGEIADYTCDLSAEAFVENYQAHITRSILVDGENHYLPLPGDYYGYIINKTLLDELGLELPETSEDLLNILAAAAENQIGVTPETSYGFGLSDCGATFIGAYFTGDFATDFLSTADGTKWLAAFEEKNAAFTGVWENSVRFLQECVDKGYIDPQKIVCYYNGRLDTDANAFKAEAQLPERTAILTYGNNSIYKRVSAATDDEIVMLPCLPYDESGNQLLSAVSNNFIAINKALESDETSLNAALTVLDFLSTEEGQSAWIKDSDCSHSYLNGYATDSSVLPEEIRSLVDSDMVFSNPFSTNLLSYLGKNLIAAVKGNTTLADALAAVDGYYINGNEDVEYDLSIVGTVACDMLYENQNTRRGETEIGNFIADAIGEVTGADVTLVNGGGIRASLYTGDVTGEDLAAVCPYGNLIILSEMDGATLKAALTNGIQKTWKPAGQFLQVSGICYSFKPAADETQTAELVSVTYADGTPLEDSDVITVAYTNYMGGSSGYVDAGDGFTMLNVYDEANPVTVTLVEETGKTYGDALKEYFANHRDEEITSALEGRIKTVE